MAPVLRITLWVQPTGQAVATNGSMDEDVGEPHSDTSALYMLYRLYIYMIINTLETLQPYVEGSAKMASYSIIIII